MKASEAVQCLLINGCWPLSLYDCVTLCLDTSLTFALLVHMHLTSVDIWEVFRSSTALTSLKFPHNLNNLFAGNKARLLKPIFHTWLSFFFFLRPIDIESPPFSFDLTSSHDRSSVNSGYTAYHTRIKTLNRQLILRKATFFDSSSWQIHKPERRRGTLLGKASFHLLLTESKCSNSVFFFLTGHGERAGLKDSSMLGPFAVFCVSISVGTAMICH